MATEIEWMRAARMYLRAHPCELNANHTTMVGHELVRLIDKAERALAERQDPSLALTTRVPPSLTRARRRCVSWSCSHTQTSARRCIRCCHPRPKWFVLRRAAGGSPAAYRWLCDPCHEVYDALGLIDSEGPERLTRTNNKPGKAFRIMGRG